MSDININLFEHSEFNTLLNNVSGGAVSNIFKKINPHQPGVLEPIQMLDENYTDPRFTLSRYDGCKTTSAKYNVYTAGDKSYGKTAAIDYTVGKFAFSNNINKKNLNFYDKAVVNIKYLIDVTGSITELSTANNNIFEVQSMYKKGDKVTLSLMDKYNPTNQSTLDGDKIIFEGGFSYSPLIYRELGELMNFTYVEPVTTTQNRLGVRAVSTSSIVWKTIGDTNGEFTSIPNAVNIFTVNGINKTTPLTVGTKVQSINWPYLKMPLTNYGGNSVPYKDFLNQIHYVGPQGNTNRGIYADDPCFYTIDYFLPSNTQTANGGYSTNDMTGKLQIINDSSGYYTYIIAPRSSDYIVNIDIPVKMKARNEETGGERAAEKGASIVKIIAILEVKKSGASNWDYLDYSNPDSPTPYGFTRFSATNIPKGNDGAQRTGTTRALINERDSFIFMSADTVATTVNGRYVSPFYEGRCQLLNHKVKLEINDELRVKLYFAEVTTFFRRNENIYFEIPSGDSSNSYFEVYDLNNSDTTLLTTATIGDDPPIFTTEPDNRTLTFSHTASLLYENVIFEPQDTANPKSLANLYSAVDFPFQFRKYDIIRFTKFFTIKPEYYYITEIIEPVKQQIGNVTTILKPLQIILDRKYIPNTVSTGSFAFFRKSPDETCVMIDFKKREGLTSNALLLPFNLEDGMKKNIGNIIAPLKDTILSKVLVVG